jgi:hypothetical protein
MSSRSDEHRRTIMCGHLQILDGDGAVRLEVGNVADFEGDYEPGIVIYDESGSARVSMALRTGLGPNVSFASGGNSVIELRVDDPGPETGVGAGHLLLADGTGAAVVDISVPHHREGQWLNPLRSRDRRRKVSEPEPRQTSSPDWGRA